MTKLSKLTKFECSPSKLCTLFLGFVPVLGAEVVLIKFGDRPLMSNGLGDVVPKKKKTIMSMIKNEYSILFFPFLYFNYQSYIPNR